jgi:hypothetical protein
MIFAFNTVKSGNSPVASRISTQLSETAIQPISTPQWTEEPFPPIYLVTHGTEEPYPPLFVPAQVTDVPYIPPDTPNLTPVSTRMIAVTFTPTNYPSPTILPTLEGPLPHGLKIVYAETDWQKGITNIWLVNITDLFKERKLLATVNNQPQFGVYGEVSPDGNKISYRVLPPNADLKSALTNGHELWIMNSDGSESRMLSIRNISREIWSPDSKFIIADRSMPIYDSAGNILDFRSELYLININNLEMKLLNINPQKSYFEMTGWSGDGKVFYYSVVTGSSWELWAVNVSTGSSYFKIASHSDHAGHPVLSPDGNWLLFTADINGRLNYIICSIDGKQRKDIITNILISEYTILPIAKISANSKNLLFFDLTETDQQLKLEKIRINNMEKQILPSESIFFESKKTYELMDWSPDEKWAVVREYPRGLNFIKIDNGEVIKMPSTQPFHWLTFFGWIDQ